MKTRHLMLLLGCLFLQLQSIFSQTGNNSLYIPPADCAVGSLATVPIQLSNDAEIVALQFDLHIPDVVQLAKSGITLTDRKSDHTMTVKDLGGNNYRVVVFSVTNTPLRGNSGTLFQLPLTIPENLEIGAVFPIGFKDVVLSKKDGENVQSGVNDGSIKIVHGDRPDITVQAIKFISSEIKPGGKVSVAWSVENVGNQPAKAGWSEQVYLVSEAGDEAYLGQLNSDELLSASGMASRQAEFTLPAYPGVDGMVYAKVKLTPYPESGELPVDVANNEALSDGGLTLEKELYLSLNRSFIAETFTSDVYGFVHRSGSRKLAETFTFTNLNPERMTFPASVTIPAGESGVSFAVRVIDDQVANPDSFIVAKVSGNGYKELSQEIWIEDNEMPKLTVIAPEGDRKEGENIELTIQREWATKWPLAVRLATDHSKRFRLDPNVVIPANEKSVKVNVLAVEDDLPDVTIDAVFTASAPGFENGVGFMKLLDNDLPDIQMEITPISFSESAGPQAAIATLRRTKVTDNKITVKLTDNSKGALYYPSSSIVLEKGETEYQFAIGVVDNDLKEEDRKVLLTAAVYISSCSCSAAGSAAGSVTKELTLLDNDGSSLKITSSQTSLIEGKTDATTLTITRNTDTSQALTVKLACDKPEEVTLSNTVVIPAGKSSVDIPVAVKENSTTEGNRTITFTASADGFSSGVCWAMITDQTLPDAVVSDLQLQGSSFLAKGEITVKVQLENKGVVPLPASTKISVYFSRRDQLGVSAEQVLLGNIYTTSALAAGESEILMRTFVLPNKTGTYYIIAVADEEHNVKEIVTTNNITEPRTIHLEPLYRAQISTDKKNYKPGESIMILGQVTGGNVDNVPVDLYVCCNDYQQTFHVTTDAQGIFQYNYTPDNWMTGHVGIAACYPGEGMTTEMAGVDIYGLTKGDTESLTAEVLVNTPFTGEIKLFNPGSSPLTHIKVELISAPENCVITFDPLESLDGDSFGEIKYTVRGTAPSDGKGWEKIKAKVTTAEGATLDVTIYYVCRTEKGVLMPEISAIKTTMTKGTYRDYQLSIVNTGKGETGKISLNIPNEPWIRLASPLEMASLRFGEKATVVLRLQPTENMPLNVPLEGTIGVNCANGTGFPLPFHITPVSESTGTLKIDVCDEYTYNTAEKPHVSGARIRITTPTNKLVAEGTTGSDGLFVKELQEGYYVIEVTADKHGVYRNTVLVDPGTETLKVVNLSVQGIEISYNVERTEIEDRYEIVMNVQFETNTPVPVVLTTVDIPQRSTDNPLRVGETIMATVTLTNKGLITAQDVQLLIPENKEGLIFEPLINEPFDLPSQSSQIIPVKITYSPQSELRASEGNDSSFVEEEGLFKGCTYHWGTAYFWDCGFDRQWHEYYTPVKIYDDCGEPLISLPTIPLPGSGGGVGGGGFGWPAGWFGTNYGFGGSVGTPTTPITNPDRDCIPCITGMTVATLKCAGHWIPAAEEIVAAVELWNAFIDALKEFAMEESGADKVVDEIYDSLTEEQKEFLEDQMENVGLGNFFAEAVQSVLNCGNLSYNHSFEAVMSCVSGVTESAEKFFDEAIDTMFKRLYPSPTDIQKKQFAKVKKLGKKAVDALKKLLNVADCLHDFATACDHLLEQQTLRSASVPGYLTDFTNRMAIVSKEMDAYMNIWLSIFGENTAWQECSIDDLARVLRELPTEGTILLENVIDVKPKEIPMGEWEWFIDRWNNTIAGNTSGNYIDIDRIGSLQQTMSDMNEQVLSWGYGSLSECITKEIAMVQEKIEGSSNSVCSTISLQFKQTMTMTRQAFRGTLTVFNGHESVAMKDVRLNLEVKDEEGNIATAYEFQINTEDLDTFGGELDGTWTLDAQKTGKATILFIPTKYAAPTEERSYSFGGTLSYVDPFTDLVVTRDLFPVTMTVKPSPNLDMTYFMQRDILGDDPLTTNKVEPIVPAEFSLLIHNTGAGDATNVNIVTDQPEIIDNEKGLNIQFELLSSQLNGEDHSLALGGSVATDFGTIEAGKTAYAQWWFTSTLLGHFTKYDVKATHVSSFDNPDLSLLDQVTIHELIRSVRVPETDLAGFLVNDIADSEDLPDMLYLSDGTIEKVALAKNATIQPGATCQYVLAVTPSGAGWNYGSISDPTNGRQTLARIVRKSDGAAIDTRNIWQTGCTLRDGKDPFYENLIHFVDRMGTDPEEYLLTFEPAPSVVLEVSSFEGVPDENEVVSVPVTEVTVRFNKEVNASTFTAEDLSLVLQGERQDASLIKIQKVDDLTFKLDLTAVTKRDGYYILTVQTAGIMDAEGYEGDAGKNASWVQYLAEGSQTLTLSLAKGWNWISMNMEGVKEPVAFLNPVKDQVRRLQNQSQELTNDPEYGLTGNLKTLVPESSYKLEMSGDGQIEVSGTALTPDQVTIDLNRGWNWIGYIPRTAASPTMALALLSANANDEIKGQHGFAKFNGTSWVGTLKQMVPGEGYMYYANTKQSFRYAMIYNTLQAASDLMRSETNVPAPWSVDIHKYPDNMSIVADLWAGDVKEEPGVCTVGAFVGEECRGVGEYVDGRLFITVYGEKGEGDISFRAIPTGSSTEWDIRETVSFGDASLGTLTEPYALHLSEMATGIDALDDSFSVYPNPVSRILYFKGEYLDIKAVSVLNMNGTTVLRKDMRGENSLDVSLLSDGVYILVIQKDDEALYHKIVKVSE